MDQYPESQERRQHVRKLLRTSAYVVLPVTGLIEAPTTDISLGGIGVVLDSNLPKGTSFLLRVALPRRGRGPVTLQARVRVMNSIFGVTEGGFKVGLRFVDIEPSAAMALSEFLA